VKCSSSRRTFFVAAWAAGCLSAPAGAGCTRAVIEPADGGSGGGGAEAGRGGSGQAGSAGAFAGGGGRVEAGFGGQGGGSAGAAGGAPAEGGSAGAAGAGGFAGGGLAGGSQGGGGAGGMGATHPGSGGTGVDAGTDAPPAVTPTRAGQIVVTELMHDTDVVADDFGEWFEIYNPSADIGYDLYGCQIRDTANAAAITAHLTVPPTSFRTLAIFATGGGFVPDYTYSGIKFDNSAGDLVSIYCGSTLIDKLSYSTKDAKVSGHSFSVDPAHYISADPKDFCDAVTIYNQSTTAGGKVVADYGTPGKPNPPCK
jgi:hypothetical protein